MGAKDDAVVEILHALPLGKRIETFSSQLAIRFLNFVPCRRKLG